jgi:hypothetical protein
MRKLCVTVLAGLLVVGGVAGLSQARNAEELKIKDVMKEGFKGDLGKKVGSGQASEDQKKRLLTLTKALADAKPPRGDEKSWGDKTKALVAAAQAAVDGKDNVSDLWKAAANCKACHDMHKGK